MQNRGILGSRPTLAFLLMALHASAGETTLELNLRSRTKVAGNFAVSERKAQWEAKKTAIIICDMWDDHWCKSASRRVAELAGPINEVVKQGRAKGAFIIHAPSSVVTFYKDTPQRQRAQTAPFAKPPAPLPTSERWGTMPC